MYCSSSRHLAYCYCIKKLSSARGKEKSTRWKKRKAKEKEKNSKNFFLLFFTLQIQLVDLICISFTRWPSWQSCFHFAVTNNCFYCDVMTTKLSILIHFFYKASLKLSSNLFVKNLKKSHHTNHRYHVDEKLLMMMRICQKNRFLFRTCVHETERKSARKSSWEVRKWEKREKEKFPTFPRCTTDFSVKLDRFCSVDIQSRSRLDGRKKLSFDFWQFV